MDNQYKGNERDSSTPDSLGGSEEFTCVETCPVRIALEQNIIRHQENTKAQKLYYAEKGFSYINAFICLGFYLLISYDYHKTNETVPVYITVIVFLSIAAAIGVKTDKVAETLGKLLSK
jgi:hypothetical protein